MFIMISQTRTMVLTNFKFRVFVGDLLKVFTISSELFTSTGEEGTEADPVGLNLILRLVLTVLPEVNPFL